MALYPVSDAGYNGINGNLFPFKVVKPLFQEWVQITPLSGLMGNEPNSPIVRRHLEAHEGLQYRMGKLAALNYKNPIVNFDQRRGNAMQQQVDYDKVDVDFKSFLVQIKGTDILDLGTPVTLPQYASSQLVEAFSRALNYDLFNAMTTTAYPNIKTAKCNVPGTLPSYDRAVFHTSTGSLLGRKNYQAASTFPDVIKASMATSAITAPANSGLSARHLETLKQYAERGGSEIGAEEAIRPARVLSKAGWPMNKYIYLAHPQSLESLFADPLFANSTFNRGVVIDPENTPQTLNGADYVGEYRGIAIYSCRDLYEYQIKGDDTHTAAWNIFMGAGALCLGWAKDPIMGMENDPVERMQLYYGHEFRGQKMLKFPSRYAATTGAEAGSNTTVEQGIIHSFVSI